MYRPFQSGTVSGKMSEETHNKVAELYNKWYQDDPTVSFKVFLERLLKELSEPVVNDNSEIINTLTGEKTDLEHKVFSLSNQLTIEQESIANLQRELKELNTIMENGDNLPQNAIIITPEPVINYFLELMASAATKQTGRPVTKADILKNLFWEQIKYGPGDHLPLFITRAQISSMIQKLKESQPHE